MGIGVPVAIGVAAVLVPRFGDELHRPDRAVVCGIPVQGAAIGIGDIGEAGRPIEFDADDRRVHDAVVTNRRALVSPVPRFHVADPGERRPREVALGQRLPHGLGRVGVGGQRGLRDVHLLVDALRPRAQLVGRSAGRTDIDFGHRLSDVRRNPGQHRRGRFAGGAEGAGGRGHGDGGERRPERRVAHGKGCHRFPSFPGATVSTSGSSRISPLIVWATPPSKVPLNQTRRFALAVLFFRYLNTATTKITTTARAIKNTQSLKTP